MCPVVMVTAAVSVHCRSDVIADVSKMMQLWTVCTVMFLIVMVPVVVVCVVVVSVVVAVDVCSSSVTGFCRDAVYSLTTDYNNGALRCDCSSSMCSSSKCSSCC